MHIEDTKFNETACVPTYSGQEKNGKNSEGSGWFQGRGGGGDPQRLDVHSYN